MRTVAILGAGGHGKVVAEAAILSQQWDKVHFFDDRYPTLKSCEVWPVVGSVEDLEKCSTEYTGVIVAIGDNCTRLAQIRALNALGINIATIVHPSATISSFSKLAPGTVVLANAVVNAFVSIGAGVIVNTSSVIEHDCVIADGVHVSPNATLLGGVEIGEECWIGAAALVKQGVKVGSGTLVGMGAVVLSDVPQSVKVIGVPARILEE